MNTLFLLSRGYYSLRSILSAALNSPFLQAGALILVAMLVSERFSAAPSAIVGQQAAGVYSIEMPIAEQRGGADERLIAWSVLADRGASGAAEKAALEHLFAVGEALDGLSFSGSGVDLSEIDLGAVDGRGAKLRGAGFAGVRLSSARLREADLTEADFTGSTMMRADLAGARLDKTQLGGVDLSMASMARASLVRARLTDAILTATDMSDVSASRTIAVGARLDGAIAINSDWRGADLTRAVLTAADFTGARLDHVRFEGAEISGAKFVGAQGLDTASFARAWAWADKPPAGLPSSARIDLCDPGLKDAKRRAHEEQSPNGGASRPQGC